MRPRSLSYACLLWLGLAASAWALPEIGALEHALGVAEEEIQGAEADFNAALSAQDSEAMRATGSRLRALKERRKVLLRDLETARAERDRREAAEANLRRGATLRRLDDLEPEVEAAAEAFDAKPTGARGAKLRRLTVEEVELLQDLRKADKAEAVESQSQP